MGNRGTTIRGTVLRQDRVPVKTSAMDATGVIRLYATVPEAAEEMDALSAFVENDVPPSEYSRFPELNKVASGSGE